MVIGVGRIKVVAINGCKAVKTVVVIGCRTNFILFRNEIALSIVSIFRLYAVNESRCQSIVSVIRIIRDRTDRSGKTLDCFDVSEIVVVVDGQKLAVKGFVQAVLVIVSINLCRVYALFYRPEAVAVVFIADAVGGFGTVILSQGFYVA